MSPLSISIVLGEIDFRKNKTRQESSANQFCILGITLPVAFTEVAFHSVKQLPKQTHIT